MGPRFHRSPLTSPSLTPELRSLRAESACQMGVPGATRQGLSPASQVLPLACRPSGIQDRCVLEV